MRKVGVCVGAVSGEAVSGVSATYQALCFSEHLETRYP